MSTTVIAEVYDAFRSAGVDDRMAKAAAASVAPVSVAETVERARPVLERGNEVATKTDVAVVDERVVQVDGKTDKLDGRVGNLEVQMAAVLKELQYLRWCVSGILIVLLTEFARSFIA